MKKLMVCLGLSAAALLVMKAQQNTRIMIVGGQKPKLAIPDFRGAGDAQKFMAAFNQTLWSDIENSGLFDLVPKTAMPLFVPQQPSDFEIPPVPGTSTRKKTPEPQSGGGRWMRDWSN